MYNHCIQSQNKTLNLTVKTMTLFSTRETKTNS